MAKIATRYGILTHVEPSNYANNYSDTAVHHRPDILFYTNPTPVATDLTIVKPSSLGAGFSASNAADNKIRHHQDAVARQLHIFIPFAMETTGCYDKRCKELVRRLANDVPKQHRAAFHREFLGVVSAALAQYRANAILNACNTTVMYHSME
jgi:hypothetical protein